MVNRRERTYAIPTDPTVTGLTNLPAPAGFEILTADRVSEDRLRELDDGLKQDVPGADGWKWDRQGFRKETYDAPDFDPVTYLVAIEQAPGPRSPEPDRHSQGEHRDGRPAGQRRTPGGGALPDGGFPPGRWVPYREVVRSLARGWGRGRRRVLPAGSWLWRMDASNRSRPALEGRSSLQ